MIIDIAHTNNGASHCSWHAQWAESDRGKEEREESPRSRPGKGQLQLVAVRVAKRDGDVRPLRASARHRAFDKRHPALQQTRQGSIEGRVQQKTQISAAGNRLHSMGRKRRLQGMQIDLKPPEMQGHPVADPKRATAKPSTRAEKAALRSTIATASTRLSRVFMVGGMMFRNNAQKYILLLRNFNLILCLTINFYNRECRKDTEDETNG